MEESQAPSIKQVIVMRHDLKMRRGKQITQGAHASMSFLTRKLQSKSSICMDEISRSASKPGLWELLRKYAFAAIAKRS